MIKSISHADILDKKLKSCDPHIKKFVLKLEAYIAKLETENARLKVDNMVLNLRVKALEAEIKKNVNLAPDVRDYGKDMAEIKATQAQLEKLRAK